MCSCVDKHQCNMCLLSLANISATCAFLRRQISVQHVAVHSSVHCGPASPTSTTTRTNIRSACPTGRSVLILSTKCASQCMRCCQRIHTCGGRLRISRSWRTPCCARCALSKCFILGVCSVGKSKPCQGNWTKPLQRYALFRLAKQVWRCQQR